MLFCHSKFVALLSQNIAKYMETHAAFCMYTGDRNEHGAKQYRQLNVETYCQQRILENKGFIH